MTKRSRFRRGLPTPTDDFKVTETPYDFRGSAEEAAANEQKEIIAANIADSGWGPVDEDHIRMIETDEDGDEFDVEYSLSELRGLHDFAVARGINEPSEFPDASIRKEAGAPTIQPQGWSGGTDGRWYRPMPTWPKNDNVLMRQGTFNIGCTAALVGRRIILTAAHCIVGADGSSNLPWYRARQDGATVPWGSFKTDRAWTDSRYLDNNCHTTYTAGTRETCGKFDYAVLRLRDNSSFPLWNASGTPGWMGYWLPASSGWSAWIDGYPACGYPHSPANCVAESVYGDNNGHSTFNWRGVVSGENTVYNTANDISPRHSGGPVRSPTYPNSSGPYVLGVVTNEMCAKCDAAESASADDKTYPTMVMAMTSWVAGIIDDGRTNYP